MAHHLRRWPNIKPTLIIIGLYAPVADPLSEEKGAPGVLEAQLQDFLVNFSQFRRLFKVFGRAWAPI